MAKENLPTTVDDMNVPAFVQGQEDAQSFAGKTFLCKAYREALQSEAQIVCKTEHVPARYKGKWEEVYVAMHRAFSLGMDPYMFMNHSYVIQGKCAIESQIAIALINRCDRISGPIRYEWFGTKDSPGFGCRACVTMKDGTVVDGPTVTMEMVRKNGWDRKTGSKWLTMPSLMFRYRAAMYLGRTHFSDVLLGMQSVDEALDSSTLEGVVVNQDGSGPMITQAMRALKTDRTPPDTPRVEVQDDEVITVEGEIVGEGEEKVYDIAGPEDAEDLLETVPSVRVIWEAMQSKRKIQTLNSYHDSVITDPDLDDEEKQCIAALRGIRASQITENAEAQKTLL